MPATSRLRLFAGAGLGGVIATSLDFIVLAALVHSGMSVPLAAFLGACSGASLCFVINRRLLGSRRPVTIEQVLRFAGVALATAVLMAGAMELVAVRLAVPYLFAKVVCAAVIFLVWSFPAQRRLVFAS